MDGKKKRHVKIMQVEKGISPTILKTVTSVGLVAYDSNMKVGYLANTVSEVEKSDGSEKTVEFLLRRIRKDTEKFFGFHVILVGDSIFSEEYEGIESLIDKTFCCFEDSWRAHQRYRRGIQEYLETQGFEHIHPFFCEQKDSWSRILLNTRDGQGVIQEFNLLTKLVNRTTFFEFPYNERNVRIYYNKQ